MMATLKQKHELMEYPTTTDVFHFFITGNKNGAGKQDFTALRHDPHGMSPGGNRGQCFFACVADHAERDLKSGKTVKVFVWADSRGWVRSNL